MGNQDSELEIVEPENYFSNKAERFSNGELVMMAFRKCIELGAKEMRDGYYNTKTDKQGNTNFAYVPDTRKELIESVETLQMIMADDVDDPTEKLIKVVTDALDKIYTQLCKDEKAVWDEANKNFKDSLNSKNIFYRQGFLSSGLPFATDFLIEKVKASRQIVGILKKRIKDLDYYREAEYHG